MSIMGGQIAPESINNDNTVELGTLAMKQYSRKTTKDKHVCYFKIRDAMVHDIPTPVKDRCSLRIELKFRLKFLHNRCAGTFTPERLQSELLVGWQVKDH